MHIICSYKCWYELEGPFDTVRTVGLEVRAGHYFLTSTKLLDKYVYPKVCISANGDKIAGWKFSSQSNHLAGNAGHMPQGDMDAGTASFFETGLVSPLGEIPCICLDESVASWMVEQALWSFEPDACLSIFRYPFSTKNISKANQLLLNLQI